MVKSGAHDLVETLMGPGADICFANPGTSEIHFVADLRDCPEMRAVLCLFAGAGPHLINVGMPERTDHG